MTTSRGTNRQLESLHTRTGWSRKELARRINQRARQRGVELGTDASRIRNWLEGRHPQPPVPELLSELFSEHFGHPIIPADIGLPATDEHELGLRYSDSIAATVIAVAELGRYDLRRRGFLHNGTFLAVAALAPSHDWLLAMLDATEPRPGSRIAEHQVSVIREAFADFQEANVMRGGGYARRALTEFVTGRVLPMLQGIDPDHDTAATVFSAAGEQTLLLGFMACDDDQQALMLGYPHEALRSAITGRHGLARASSPACTADLWALQAQAHAALDDAKAATHAVLESERSFERIDVANEPKWARFIDHANLSCHWADAFATLQRPVEAIRFARCSISNAAEQNRARRGALAQAALAQAALTSRDLDAALHSAHRAVDLSATVQSSRCTAAIRDLRTRISPYRTLTPARDFDDRARQALICG